MRHEGRVGHERRGLRRGRERSGHARQGKALELIQRLPSTRAGSGAELARRVYPMVETSATVMVNATDLASHHGLTIWDPVVLAASSAREK